MRWVVGVGVVMILAVAGCSGSGGNGPGGAPTAAANAGLGAAPSSATPSANVTKRVSTASFQTPSRNIGCYLSADSVRCDIGNKQWAPPPKPSDCGSAWGMGVTVDGRAEASFTCAGDTVLGAGHTLRYGQSLRAGDFVCDSLFTEIRCGNVDSGHGFALSVQAYRLF
jgi:hypothetical protein